MATSKTSVLNAVWTGPVVCVLVMAAVFLALWWATRQMEGGGPSSEETETFMADAGTNEDGRADEYTILHHKHHSLTSRDIAKDDDRPTKLCDLREELRHLQKQILDAQPGVMLRVPDNNDAAMDPTTEYTK